MKLSLRFLSLALVYFVAGEALGVAGIFTGVGFAHVHILLVGFVSLVIIGTVYQQAPTLAGKELSFKSLGEASFWLVNAGLLLSLATDMGYWVLTSGFVAFSIVAMSTMLPSLRKSYVFSYYVTAVLFLTAGAVLGALGVASFTHAHIALVGGVSLLIAGAMSWMLPMVTLSKIFSRRLMALIFPLFVAGTLLLSAKSLSGAWLILTAAILFTANMLLSLRSAKGTSIEGKFFVAALFYFIVALVLGMLLANGYSLKAVHVHIALLGFVIQTILGGLYHVIPMLCYVELLPKLKERTPGVKELVSEEVSKVVFLSFNLGVVLLSYEFYSSIAGIKLLGGSFVLFATLLFTAEMFSAIGRVINGMG